MSMIVIFSAKDALKSIEDYYRSEQSLDIPFQHTRHLHIPLMIFFISNPYFKDASSSIGIEVQTYLFVLVDFFTEAH